MYLGFSRKESRGFVLLIPVLVLMTICHHVIGYYSSARGEEFYQAYTRQLDSLLRNDVVLIDSPGPLFNPMDTVKGKRGAQLDHIQKIPFHESDSITLQIVPGIGATLAGRIIKYRERLGGLQSKSQLYEVYGLKKEVIESIWEFFEFESLVSRPIRINKVSLDELAAHPYINYGEAKVLLAYRDQHGPLQSPDDLLKIKIFKEEWVWKISPYFFFD